MVAQIVAVLDRLSPTAGPGNDAAPAHEPAPTWDPTPREHDVLRLVAEEWSNPEIAEVLFISPRTASAHVSRILGRLSVENRAEAAALAVREGLDLAADGIGGRSAGETRARAHSRSR